MKRGPVPAAVRWYAEGFAIGAAGGSVRQRKGRPRLASMLPHWQEGIRQGAFARDFFVGGYHSSQRPPVRFR